MVTVYSPFHVEMYFRIKSSLLQRICAHPLEVCHRIIEYPDLEGTHKDCFLVMYGCWPPLGITELLGGLGPGKTLEMTPGLEGRTGDG